MTVFTNAAEKFQEQAIGGLETGERVTLAVLDVTKAAAALLVPVMVPLAPNKAEITARADALIERAHAIAAEVVTAGYEQLGDAIAASVQAVPFAA